MKQDEFSMLVAHLMMGKDYSQRFLRQHSRDEKERKKERHIKGERKKESICIVAVNERKERIKFSSV